MCDECRAVPRDSWSPNWGQGMYRYRWDPALPISNPNHPLHADFERNRRQNVTTYGVVRTPPRPDLREPEASYIPLTPDNRRAIDRAFGRSC